jgi:hypothetical protein
MPTREAGWFAACATVGIVCVSVYGCSSMLGFDELGFDHDDAGTAGQSGTGGSAGSGAQGGTGGTSATGGTGSAGSAGSGGTGQAGAAGSGGTTVTPFDCDLPPATPSLAPELWTHPTEPKAGEAITLIVWSDNTEPNNAPQLVGEITNRNGSHQVTDYTMVGGGNATYYVTFAELAEGENCLVLRNGSNVEVAHKVDAPGPGAGLPRGNGPWKVTTNHQWRCDEQPTNGNLLHVRVTDENGSPVQGATVNIRWTDDTVFPVKPDDTAMSWAEHQHPKTLTTGADGRAELFTPWGEGVRTPIDGKPKLLVFLLSMDGGASDTATEITTGLWETDASGCNYCSTHAVNVFGHWSHTVEFQRNPAATEVCEVPIDHAGQQSCSHTHFFHDPDRPSCLPVAP